MEVANNHHRHHQQQQQQQQLNLQKARADHSQPESSIGAQGGMSITLNNSGTLDISSDQDYHARKQLNQSVSSPPPSTPLGPKIQEPVQQPKMAYLRVGGHQDDNEPMSNKTGGVTGKALVKMASLSPGGKGSRRKLSAVKSLSSNFLDKLSHMLLRRSASSLTNSSSSAGSTGGQVGSDPVPQAEAGVSLNCGCADRSASSSIATGIDDGVSADQQELKLRDKQNQSSPPQQSTHPQLASTPCVEPCHRQEPVNWSRSSAMNLASGSLGDGAIPHRFAYSASVGNLGDHHNLYHNRQGDRRHHHYHHHQFDQTSSPELGGLCRGLTACESAPMPNHPTEGHHYHHHNYLATPSIKSDNSSSVSVKLDAPTSDRKSSQKEKRKRQKEAERVEKLRLLVSYLRSGSQNDHLLPQPIVLDPDEVQYQSQYHQHHHSHINNAGSLSPTATNTTIGTCHDASIRSSTNSTACSSSLNLQNSPPKLFYIGDFERQSTNSNQNQYTVTLKTINHSALPNQQRPKQQTNTQPLNTTNSNYNSNAIISPATMCNDTNADVNMNCSCNSFGTSSIATTVSTAASPSTTNLDAVNDQSGSLVAHTPTIRSSSSAWSNPQNLATWIDNEVNSLVSDLEATSHLVKSKKGSTKRKWLSSSFTRRSSSGAQST